jgi:hypothetical protein
VAARRLAVVDCGRSADGRLISDLRRGRAGIGLRPKPGNHVPRLVVAKEALVFAFATEQPSHRVELDLIQG